MVTAPKPCRTKKTSALTRTRPSERSGRKWNRTGSGDTSIAAARKAMMATLPIIAANIHQRAEILSARPRHSSQAATAKSAPCRSAASSTRRS